MTRPTAGTTPATTQRGGRFDGILPRLTKRTVFWITVINVLIIVMFGVISPNHVFLSLANTRAVLIDASEIVVLAVGEAILLGAAQLDISIGANVIMSSVVGAKVMVAVSGASTQVKAGVYPHVAAGIVAGTIACLATGVLFGLINGLIVAKLRVNALIATLGTMGIGTGLAFVITNGVNVPYVPPPFQTGFGNYSFFDVIPFPAIIAAILCVAAWFLITKTRLGLRILTMGSSRPAAERAGLPVIRNTIVVFMMVGLLAGFAGLVDIGRFGTTDVSGHVLDPLSAIAGAVIGGTSLFGGEVSIGGGVMGAVLTVLVQVGLVIVGLPTFYAMIAVGVVLVIAVAIDERRRTLRNTGTR